MKYYLTLLALTLLSVTACDLFNSDETTSPDNSGLIMDGIEESETIIAIDDESFIVEKIDCDDDDVIFKDSVTRNYEIANGLLYTWEDDDCDKMEYTPDSDTAPTTLQGKWHTDYSFVSREIDDCENNENIAMMKSATDLKATITISDSSAHFDYSGSICMGTMMAQVPLDSEMTENGPAAPSMAFSNVTCNSLRMETTVKEGLTIPVDMSFHNGVDGITLNYSINGCGGQAAGAFGGSNGTCEESMEGPIMGACMAKYLLEEGCYMDLIVPEIEGDVSSSMSKKDCNTLEIKMPITDSIALMYYDIVPEGIQVTTTVYGCSKTCLEMPYSGESQEESCLRVTEDEEYDTCVEEGTKNALGLKMSMHYLDNDINVKHIFDKTIQKVMSTFVVPEI
ncbi:MAG: hypothetical protein OCC49_15005 [Fibrobacterales bacterium]